MSMAKNLSALAFGMFLVFFLSGCGGNDLDKPSGPSGTLTATTAAAFANAGAPTMGTLANAFDKNGIQNSTASINITRGDMRTYDCNPTVTPDPLVDECCN